MLGTDTASKKQRRREDYGYILDYRTRWSDNDVYFHMNNSIYSFLIDSIINDYLQKECGRSPATSLQVGLAVNSYCDYFGEVAYPSVLELGLRVARRGTTSIMWEVGVFEQGKAEVKAVGGLVHVFVSSKTRRPIKDNMEATLKDGLDRLERKQQSAKL